MSLCDICKNPGACCRGFTVTREDGKPLLFDRDPLAPWQHMLGNGLPFVPTMDEPRRVLDPVSGQEMLQYRFSCSALGPDGRCRVYEIRPVLCRRFEAGTSELCVFGSTDQTRPAR